MNPFRWRIFFGDRIYFKVRSFRCATLTLCLKLRVLIFTAFNFFSFFFSLFNKMGLFSNYFKQLFAKRERRSSTTSSSWNGGGKNNKSTSNSLTKKSNSIASNNQISVITSQQSSKEGHSFRYNEDGRRYHGNEEVAYVLPNDDDGLYYMIIAYRRAHILTIKIFYFSRGRSCTSTTLDFKIYTSVVNIFNQHYR
jgi:hypothetical protein